MLRLLLEWQDRRMDLLASVTLVFALTGVAFVGFGWELQATATIVAWCALMMLFVLVNAVGWAWILRGIRNRG